MIIESFILNFYSRTRLFSRKLQFLLKIWELIILNFVLNFCSGTRCLSRKLQSSSCYSSSSLWVSVYELHSVNSIRKIATFPPLCMGRRSCKIAGRKVATWYRFRMQLINTFLEQTMLSSLFQ